MGGIHWDAVAIALIFANRGCSHRVVCAAGRRSWRALPVWRSGGFHGQKRHFGVKDFGHLLPGHGGLMDRLDSTIFILPVVWLFFLYTTGV